MNINSISGVVGTPMRCAYSASKFAMSGYFEALRAEVAPHNIKITNVYPGHIATNVSINAVSNSGEKFGKVDANNAAGYSPADLAQKIL